MGFVKLPPRKALSKTLYSCIRHITKLLSQRKNRALLTFIFTWLFLIWAGCSFIFARTVALLAVTVYPAFHRYITFTFSSAIFPSDSSHSTSHRTLFTENLAAAICKSPQMKNTNVVRLKMAKNSVYKLKTLLKWKWEIVFSKDTLWVWLSSQAAYNLFEIYTIRSHLRWLDTVFQGQYLPSLRINYVAINKVLEKLPPQLF